MTKGFFKIPAVTNENVFNYEPASNERGFLKEEIAHAYSVQVDIPMYIGAEEVRTGTTKEIRPPHNHRHIIGHYHEGNKTHVEQAINAALSAKAKWEALAWEQRAAIFLKAAELAAGPYRYKLNAATMLGQSKNVYQAEIDAACELVDFLRFNVQYMTEIYAHQPGVHPHKSN